MSVCYINSLFQYLKILYFNYIEIFIAIVWYIKKSQVQKRVV